MGEKVKGRLTNLPITLMIFPVMLLGLCLCALWGAILGTLLASVILFIISYLRGGRQETSIGLVGSCLQILIFLLLTYLCPDMEAQILVYQSLWMLSFISIHGLGLLLLRHNRFPRLSRPSCCCDKRRNETLIAEYLHFDRLALSFCLFSIVLYVSVIVFVGLSHYGELLLSFALAGISGIAILLESIHISWLKHQLSKEHWVPIMNQHQEPIGRLALSEIDGGVDGYLPIVRLLSVSDGMIYLEKGSSCVSSNIERYDTPFADWLVEGERPIDIAQRMIDARFCGVRRVAPRPLLPYLMEENNRRYLVYLFVVQIEDPTQLYIDCRPIEGKWWTLAHLKQATLSLEMSPNIQSEITFIEQTVLLAQRLKQQIKSISIDDESI